MRLGLLMLLISGAVFGAQSENYWVSLQFIDSNEKKIASINYVTSGTPVVSSDGSNDGYPAVSCEKKGTVTKKVLKSVSLFDGIRVRGSIEKKMLLLNVELHKVDPNSEAVMSLNRDECRNVEPSVEVTNKQLQLAQTSGEPDIIKLGNGMSLIYQFEIHDR